MTRRSARAIAVSPSVKKATGGVRNTSAKQRKHHSNVGVFSLRMNTQEFTTVLPVGATVVKHASFSPYLLVPQVGSNSRTFSLPPHAQSSNPPSSSKKSMS
jgi:hypothetical protein